MKVKLLFLFLTVQMFLAPGCVKAQWSRVISKALKAAPHRSLTPVIAGATLTRGYQAYQKSESHRQRIVMRQLNTGMRRVTVPSYVSPAYLDIKPVVRKTTYLKGIRTNPKAHKKK